MTKEGPPVARDHPFDRILDEAERILRTGWRGRGTPRLLAIGWATVDLDRAVMEFGLLLGGLAAPTFVEGRPDTLLGATCRMARPVGSREPWLVLLEPATEGRLAASLARFGEGVAAVYVDARPASGPTMTLADAARGASASGAVVALADGPLGPARLAAGTPRWGPHMIVVETIRVP